MTSNEADTLELCCSRDTNPLPGQEEVELATRPVLAIVPLVHPLLLRFRWHFDGDRNTNRIDKVSHTHWYSFLGYEC